MYTERLLKQRRIPSSGENDALLSSTREGALLPLMWMFAVGVLSPPCALLAVRVHRARAGRHRPPAGQTGCPHSAGVPLGPRLPNALPGMGARRSSHHRCQPRKEDALPVGSPAEPTHRDSPVHPNAHDEPPRCETRAQIVLW